MTDNFSSQKVNQLVDEAQQTQIYHPKHYMGYSIEPITFCMINDIPFAEGNVIKYVCRWRKKNGVQDLKKARRYLDMLIELEENKADYVPKKGTL